jgi:hypothetical protein
MLNTSGASLESPYKIALDPVAGKVYWANTKPEPNSISWANVNGSGGGNLDLSGAPAPEGITGLSVDPVGGRIYWLDRNEERIGFASLSGGGGGEVNLAGVTFGENNLMDNPYGLAFDPSVGRLYWANYNQDSTNANAIGFVNLAGGSGGITPAVAPVDGPQDPVILKSPTATGAPAVGRDASNPAALTCPTGSWAGDYAGSFVYQAPRSYGYQWSLNGAAVAGATSSTFTATTPGAYTCTVTATNQTGSASQTSGAAATVKAAKVKLTVKPKKAKAKAGKTARFKVQALNQGDLQSGKAKLCVKLAGKAKKALKAPECKTLGKVGGRQKRNAKLKLKVKPDADPGNYKITIQVKGSAGKAGKATVKVLG